MTKQQQKDLLYDFLNPWLQRGYPQQTLPIESDYDYVRLVWADQGFPQVKPPFIAVKMITGRIKVGDDDIGQRTQVQTLTFSTDLITGNEIDGKVDGVDIKTVEFSNDNLETMRILAGQLRKLKKIVSSKVNRDNENQIIIESDETVALSNWGVTGGASQPSIATAETRDNDGSEAVGMRRVTLSFNCFGVTKNPSTKELEYGATDILERLYNAQELPAFLADARKYEVGIIECTDPNNTTEILETDYEDRAQMDFYIYLPFNRDVSEGEFIEQVNIPPGTAN